MYVYLSKPKSPSYTDYGSFILCRPGKSYKLNSNVSIIKSEPNPMLFDVGLSFDMMFQIEKVLKKNGKRAKDIKLVIISHYHPDHILNLLYMKRFFPNIRVIWHEDAYKSFITIPHNSTEKVFPYAKRSFPKIFTHIPQIMEVARITSLNKNYICKDNDLIPTFDSNFKLRVIHTPGHSSGHICLHDISNKVLFLGDFLPLTPWLDISDEAIDDMIKSIKRILKFTSKNVQISVRAHGNITDNTKEVYPWEEEKARFEEYLELIHDSIERIISLLTKRAMTVEELAYFVLKNKDYRGYSSLMNLLFMPPNLSWIVCYLLKLQKENKVKQLGHKWVAI